MRITNNIVYNNLLKSLTNNTDRYRKLQMEATNERSLFKPSDDPRGISISTDHRTAYESYLKYIDNIEVAEDNLNTADSALDNLYSILNKAKSAAQLAASENSTKTSREVAADQIQSYIDQTLNLMNTKVRGRYIFSGYKSELPPYTQTGRILPPYISADNTFKGNTEAFGEYTGTKDKSYLIKIDKAGTFGEATYKVSTDNGETWSESKKVYAKNNLEDGVGIEFKNGATFGEGDEFKLHVVRGKFQGDNSKIKYQTGLTSTITTNVTAYDILEKTNYFDNMYQLKFALQNDNTKEISEALERLDGLQAQLEKATVRTGVYLNQAKLAKTQLTNVKDKIRETIQHVEGVDLSSTLTQLAKQESSLKASISLMSNIFPKSLIDYLQ